MISNQSFFQNYRRAISRLILPFFTFWLMILPVKSYAVLPAIPILGQLVLSNGARVALTQALSAGIGTSIAYVAVYVYPGTDDQLRIPVAESFPVPPPDAAATAVAVETPVIGSRFLSFSPTTAGPSAANWLATLYLVSPNYVFCAGEPPDGGSYSSRLTVQVGNPAGTGWGNPCDTIPITMYAWDIAGAPVIECPSGYVDSAGTCVLSDARQAAPDKACDIGRSGSALAMLSDPDCAGSGTAISEICSSGGVTCTGVKFDVYGKDLDANPVRTVITPRPDGGSTIDHYRQRVVGNTPVVDRTTIGVDAGGTLDTISGGTQTGSIPVDGTTPAPSTDVPPVDLNIPTDYARSGEAQDAIDSISPSIIQMTDALTKDFIPPTGIDPVLPMQDRIDALNTAPATPSITWMPSLFPGNAVVCTAMPIDGAVHGGLLDGLTGTASFDICDKVDIVRQILGYLLFVGTVVYIYRRFTQSNSGA